MTKQASQREERKRTHKKQALLFSIRCCNIFQELKSSIFRTHKILYQVCCCFSSLQTLSLIYHLFSFPTTHFQLIALKPTDEKDSFCLLPLVFDRLYRRLFLILCKDITLNHAFGFFFFCLSQSDTIADESGPSVSDRHDPPISPTLCRHYSVNAFVF